ncbi:hypothetical protein DZC73_05835 [Albitalea terrae]|uniref:Uncharacterized protein n=1 Tax=Piscinibacter terrae TaxID=2496871 RepID=A0A3N7K6L6_9BURK|nr:hypothetical protein DZC73_05835 [Albitalea terrae]
MDAGALVSLEFQLGTSLVWFQFSAASNEVDSIAKGNKLLRLAHASKERAMQLANTASRSSIPQFWTEFDSTTSQGNPLSIWGVLLRIDDGDIEYDFGANQELFFSSSTTFSVLDVYEENPIPLPDFPDRQHIYVVRTRADEWAVRSSAD